MQNSFSKWKNTLLKDHTMNMQFDPLILLHFFVVNNDLCQFSFRFILHAKKTGFVVEHDFIMATYLADRVIVFEGTPSVKTVANA